jgi:hypothetical protein
MEPSLAKMSEIKELTGESIRDLVDARERYDQLREAEHDLRHGYGGSCRFEKRGDTDYLIYRPYGSSTRKSRGPRSPSTESILSNFVAGKSRTEDRVNSLRSQLEQSAPILRARGLGRVPTITARIMRRLDRKGWLGTSLIVIGTNALFAYEAMAGVRIDASMLATGDIDVLFDVRRRLALTGDIDERGLVGVLQKVDTSFARMRNRTYTAANRDGYMVDLLEPQDHARIMHDGPARLSDRPDDLLATTTDSSRWLLNTPKFIATAIDEKGLPVRIVTLDPRVFALQKSWIVNHDATRDPAKRRRDAWQARVAATISTRYLGLSFDDPALSGLPKSFRDLADDLQTIEGGDAAEW